MRLPGPMARRACLKSRTFEWRFTREASLRNNGQFIGTKLRSGARSVVRNFTYCDSEAPVSELLERAISNATSNPNDATKWLLIFFVSTSGGIDFERLWRHPPPAGFVNEALRALCSLGEQLVARSLLLFDRRSRFDPTRSPLAAEQRGVRTRRRRALILSAIARARQQKQRYSCSKIIV
jgi:hypothetical protein